MRERLENPIVFALVVGLGAALLFLALKAAMGDFDGATPVIAVGAGVGAAVGGYVSRRAADRRERR